MENRKLTNKELELIAERTINITGKLIIEYIITLVIWNAFIFYVASAPISVKICISVASTVIIVVIIIMSYQSKEKKKAALTEGKCKIHYDSHIVNKTTHFYRGERANQKLEYRLEYLYNGNRYTRVLSGKNDKKIYDLIEVGDSVVIIEYPHKSGRTSIQMYTYPELDAILGG